MEWNIHGGQSGAGMWDSHIRLVFWFTSLCCVPDILDSDWEEVTNLSLFLADST